MTPSPEGARNNRLGAVRSALLAITGIWFLVQAFERIGGDSPHEVIALLQRLAFGLALLAIALIDWRRARWWWLILGFIAVAAAWVGTGHPLLFLVGM